MKCAALASLLLLSACGGGGSTSSNGQTGTSMIPEMKVFQPLNLARSIAVANGSLSGTGQLLNCPTAGQQIEIKNVIYEMITLPNGNTTYGSTYYFFISGNLGLPNGGQFTCNTTGMTGNITSVKLLDATNSEIYTLNNLNLPAASIQNGWRGFWQDVLKQNNQINLTTSNAFAITCSNSSGTTLSNTLTGVTDLSKIITACTQ